GHTDYHLQKRSGVLTGEVKNKGDRQRFLWCHLEWRNDQYEVTVQPHQGSGQNRSIQGANALLTIPAGTAQIAQGEQVEVLLLE
ncbi:MAG: hypothetical protein KAU27_04100, partial [Desulfuromonadales bacterium]|nr:hypothetical protein [Desulfuromonadales bacterium]